ncbi:MAG: zinc metallopeptidase [Candidatus Margulisiibacteriota bacterium]
MFYDPTFILLIPAMLLAMYAQFKVKSTYEKYSQVNSSKGLTGAEAARQILDQNKMSNVGIESTPGELTDHYDPRDQKLYLSQNVYGSRSVAAIGVAAHEAGHAIQDVKLYMPLKIRNGLVPVTNLGSTLAFPLFLVGMFASMPIFMDIGIILFSIAVAFSLVTLPVEFNASKRAIAILSNGMLTEQEVPMAKAVLNAAAMTYVASTAMAVLNLIRLLVLRNERD